MRNLTIGTMFRWLWVLAALHTSPALAQKPGNTFPSRPVSIIIPLAPGGSQDVEARLFGPKLGEILGQPIIIDHKPGGGGIIGTAQVAKAAPDGHTLLMISPTFTISAVLSKSLPYDSIKDFAPIGMTTRLPSLLVVHPSVPAKNLQEYVAYAKANPDKINFGGSGVRSFTQLAAGALHSATGVKVTYVPYKGMGDAVNAMLGGHVQAALASTGASLAHVKAGKIRALGINLLERSKVLPDVPTIAEQGVSGYNLASWAGLVAPAGTPSAIVNQISAALAKAMHAPEVSSKLAEIGVMVIGGTPEELRKQIADEIVVWTKVSKEIGIQPE